MPDTFSVVVYVCHVAVTVTEAVDDKVDDLTSTVVGSGNGNGVIEFK